MSSSDGAAASAAADGAAPARTGLGARLATLAERFRTPPATRLSLVILLTVFFLVRASPDVFLEHLALVPGHTVPRFWNVVTSSWVEKSFVGVTVAAVSLVVLGRVVEPGMGAKELVRFLIFVSFFVGSCAFVFELVRFHFFGKDDKALFEHHCGFQGIVAGLLVVVKRDNPDAPVNVRGLRWARREQLCGFHVLVTLLVGLATGADLLSTFGFACFGLYGGWVYLRHIQLRPEGELGVGDPSEKMDLVSFFPKSAAPLLAPALDLAHEFLCGRRQRRLAASYGVGSLHAGLGKHAVSTKPGVTTDDAAEAQRRRERGAKALAERLALKAKKNSASSLRATDVATMSASAPGASASGSVAAGAPPTTLGEETAVAV
jgi:membrane associated rhomboid family serine protease